MTRLNDENLKKVERALTEAHRSRQQPVLGSGWTQYVMRDIHKMAAEPERSMMPLGFDRLVWRTAAVAAMLAMVFTGSVLFYTDRNAAELTALLSGEFDVTVPLE
jgi:hypothetical protein